MQFNTVLNYWNKCYWNEYLHSFNSTFPKAKLVKWHSHPTGKPLTHFPFLFDYFLAHHHRWSSTAQCNPLHSEHLMHKQILINLSERFNVHIKANINLMCLPAQPSSASASRLSNLSSSLSSLALRMDGRSIGSEHHEGGPLPLGPLK